VSGSSVTAIAVHGGAGPLPRAGLRDERACRAALERSLEAAHGALAEGAVAAAQAAVEVLEDDPHFNAGRGSVPNRAGEVEMDAAVMCGRTRRAGAVAAIGGVRHPVAVARAVMERSPHVLLVSAGAEAFAIDCGAELVDSGWFAAAGGERDAAAGTVGAVVLDGAGALAAATSTGGRRGQLPGRVGDSPLPGAGTYADATCAVSLTGDGEAIMRAAGGHELSALMRLGGIALEEACERVLAEAASFGGAAGLIAVDREGRVAAPFTTALMHRGWKVGDGPARTAILP
jgi:L-asparaginase / beta-aspartyl-peptidase